MRTTDVLSITRAKEYLHRLENGESLLVNRHGVLMLALAQNDIDPKKFAVQMLHQKNPAFLFTYADGFTKENTSLLQKIAEVFLPKPDKNPDYNNPDFWAKYPGKDVCISLKSLDDMPKINLEKIPASVFAEQFDSEIQHRTEELNLQNNDVSSSPSNDVSSSPNKNVGDFDYHGNAVGTHLSINVDYLLRR